MNWLNVFTKPYYVYRPVQILRRLQYLRSLKQARSSVRVKLPWGHHLWVNPADDLGQTLLTAGINDLALSESIYRLLDAGQTAVDVGANLGYTTSLMTAKTQPGGKVWSFEPHPQLFQELSRHLADWQTQDKVAVDGVQLFNAAVSNASGSAVLIEPADFRSNRGLSHLQAVNAQINSTESTREHQTALVTLDETLAAAGEISLLKVDVEGHEESVFSGAANLLAAGRIHHIVYEEFHPYPAPTHQLLKRFGYEIYVVEERLLGPRLVKAGSQAQLSPYAPPNYLATRRSEELKERFKPHGWKCLRSKS